MSCFDCVLTPIVTFYTYVVLFLFIHIVVLFFQVLYGIIFIWLYPCFPETYLRGFAYFQHISSVAVFGLNPFWSIRIVGKMPKVPGGVIMMPNHLCYVDPFVIGYSIMPRHFTFVANGSLFNYPIFGQVLTLSGHLAVYFYQDKKDNNKWKVKNRDSLLKESKQALARGRRLIVFPEGTLSKTGELREFKIGYFAIAKETGAKILPMAMWGNQRLFPPGGACGIMRTGRVEVTFGDLIDPADFETAELLRDHVRSTIEAMQKTLPSFRKAHKLDVVVDTSGKVAPINDTV